MNNSIRIVGLLLFIGIFFSCRFEHEKINPKYLTGYDIEIYENTKAWELAQAVKKEHVRAIKKIIAEDTSLLNFQDSRIRMNLLNWAVFNKKYKSVEALAQLGADPNLSDIDGHTAFINSAADEETSAYLKLLLRYGGKVNAEFIPDSNWSHTGVTPLCAAASKNLENVKILIAAGADVNYSTVGKDCALLEALIKAEAFNGTVPIATVKYLVIDCKADVNKPLFYDDHICNFLRDMDFDLGSQEYQIKMEIVDYLKQQGIDYRKEPIPEDIAKRHDKEYLDKY